MCSRPQPGPLAYVCRTCRERPATDWRTLCASCRASQCASCGGLHGTHRNAHRVAAVPVPDPISQADLEAVILGGYGLAHRHARAIVGDEEAMDAVHSAMAGMLRRRVFLRPPLSAWYLVKAARTEALMMLRARRRVVLVDDLERVEIRQRQAERGRRVLMARG